MSDEKISVSVADTEDESFVDDGVSRATSDDFVEPKEDGSLPDDAPKGAEEGERPSWLPEKFKSPEDLAQAYTELQKKLGSGEGEKPKDSSLRLSDPPKSETPKDDKSKAVEAGVDLDALAIEYMANEKLSEETYTALEGKGLPRAAIDRYIRGLQAEAAQIRSKVTAVVGGEENLPRVLAWAKANLSAAEKTFFDQALQSGNEAAAVMAMRGIFAQYTDANGEAPELISEGNKPKTSGGIKPFDSQVEMFKAMDDPRYRDDPKYRATVEKRMAISNVM